jgi:hypothetical protein
VTIFEAVDDQVDPPLIAVVNVSFCLSKAVNIVL